MEPRQKISLEAARWVILVLEVLVVVLLVVALMLTNSKQHTKESERLNSMETSIQNMSDNVRSLDEKFDRSTIKKLYFNYN